MDALATAGDLSDRGIEHESSATLGALLAAASAEVRQAAGVPISRGTWTVDLEAPGGDWLTLPGAPVSDVTDVLVDGHPVADWRRVGSRLWRRRGWRSRSQVAVVTATITGGMDPVPSDIVDLVCGMVGSALPRVESGYASRIDDPASIRIDDYSESYTVTAEDRLTGAMELPDRTRRRLRARFGGGATVLATR